MPTIALIKQIADRATAAPAAIPCAMSIVIVDGRANLVYAERMDDTMPVEGGVPLLADEGRIEGAIGVSGGTAQRDGIAAQAAADWLLQKTS
jgi:uncharacterized protein GlcG (DUF336 family)